MAHDEELAERVRGLLPDLLDDDEELGQRRMFGGLAFLVRGRMTVAVSGRGGLMVRADPAAAQALLGRDGVGPVVMRERPVRGWVLVDPDTLAADDGLRGWLAVAVDAVRGLA